MKTLIYHNGALGDLLLSLPCMMAIRREAPIVHIAGREDVAGLLRDAGYADEVSSSGDACYASLYTETPGIRMVESLSRFERAFLFVLRGDSLLCANVRKMIPRTETIITIPPEGGGRHVAEFRLKQLSCRGTGDSVSALPVPVPYRERARAFLAGSGCDCTGKVLVVAHPGSGGHKKRWPIERYLMLAQRMIQSRDVVFLFLSGQAETCDLKETIEAFARRHERVAHMSDAELTTVAGLLNMCDLYVGNDSGITHLAAVVKANVLALFGPTDPACWKPLGERVTVMSVRAPGTYLDGITVDDVYRGAMALLSRT